MISVAMTTYNGEKYIKKQLLSIIKQTRKPDEVIIVDDCSTDNTVEIVAEFLKISPLTTNWKLIVLPTNGGFIQSFNKAISETSGDIIFLCDQDDIWLPNKIEIMSEVMLHNPHILSLASSFKKIDANDQEIITRKSPFSSNNNLIRKRIRPNKFLKISPFRIVAYNISPGCTCAFRSNIKEIYKKINTKDMRLVHDWKINLIASLLDGLYFLNTPTILYRLHDNNSLGMTRDITIDARLEAYQKSVNERIYMQNIIKKLICQYNFLDSYKNKELYNYVNNLRKGQLERAKAIKERSIFHSLCLLFKYNLLKNRVYESLIIDIIVIMKSFVNKQQLLK